LKSADALATTRKRQPHGAISRKSRGVRAGGWSCTQTLTGPLDTLVEFGIGLTDLCKLGSGSDEEVGKDRFDRDRLEANLARMAPRRVAFNGKNAAQGALSRKVDFGQQDETIDDAEVWVLPSSSGAARRYWNVAPWRDLARAAEASRSSFMMI
jgi:G:T/U-mismatch repair DNA glycosylase